MRACSKHMICEMFHDWQWVRNDALWAEKALEYLPRVEDATNMLVCAEDLGTVPISSPHVLDSLNITRLVIQVRAGGGLDARDPDKE
jgi:4-alpha-glucanotransferase